MTDEPIANWSNEDNVYIGAHPKWYRHAICYGLSGDWFFEEGRRRLVIEAGVWGGTTTTERRRELRRRIRSRGASQ